ncbi:hypothetical protein GP486_002498 [Trichoglossum hirsutum]|uniref:Histone acetyltransferase type B catalytic subunit n=1 Tax=Trichoglossum hirsutum TaxID=265104 RepID=A0A9P8LEY6_9PEZI|nr:hypothetical protein GP486_002498 [Trichoglossum hirsutum]
MAGPDEWLADANQAVTVSLVQQGATAPQEIASFHPKFTYPIFGREEQIFGYQDLSVHLRFAAHDLLPNLEVTWNQKFKTIGDVEATDIEGTLKDWLSPTAFQKTVSYLSDVQDDKAGDAFKPPGERITSYRIKDRSFEVWRGKLADPAVRRILGRMQIFISFFIEGGRHINFDEQVWSLDRWTVFFLYEKLARKPLPHSSAYSFIGYSTAYRYYFYDQDQSQTSVSTIPKAYQKQALFDFTFPLKTPPQHPSRERISQFLILPPYQSQGHGSRLYGALVEAFLSDPTIKEITVEDPNEAFDDLRDFCDLKRLRGNGTFENIKINTGVSIPRSGKLPTSKIIDKTLLQKQRLRNKIAPRQFERLVEMHLLSLIPLQNRRPSSLTEEYGLWRLLAKQRLYKFNRQSLAQLDLPERIDKLEEVFQGVESDYVRLLRGQGGGDDEELDIRPRKAAGSEGTNGSRGKKRAIGRQEEDKESESESYNDNYSDDDEQMEETGRPAKRTKAWR